jgi:hypothetical protein
MESISRQRLKELHDTAGEIWKLELRDHYGIDGQLFAAWQSGDLDAVTASYRRWRDRFVAEFAEPNRSYRRVRVVTEPLSPYQRMAATQPGALQSGSSPESVNTGAGAGHRRGVGEPTNRRRASFGPSCLWSVRCGWSEVASLPARIAFPPLAGSSRHRRRWTATRRGAVERAPAYGR